MKRIIDAPPHVLKAIKKAIKEGHKDVTAIDGGMAKHHWMNDQIFQGKLEVFHIDGIALLRRPK